MFSERTARVVRGACAVALVAALGSQACGRKEDPKPPPRKNPARTTDLKARQRGMTLALTMTYPSTTVGGLALPGIDRVRYQKFSRPAPEFMERPEEEALAGAAEGAPEGAEAGEGAAEAAAGETAPEATAPAEPPTEGAPAAEGEPAEAQAEPGAETTVEPETPVDPATTVDPQTGEPTEPLAGEPPAPNPFLQIRVDPDEFRKRAEEMLILEGEALDRAVLGGKIVVSVPLDEIPTDPPVAHTFRVETFAGRLRSAESNFASFVPLPPPSPPTGLTLAPEPRGVTLSWEAVAPTEGEAEIEGYHVYRRQPESDLFPDPLATVAADVTEYFDQSARFGTIYVYAVTSVRMKNPVVESELSAESEIAFSDDFPPSAPKDLVVLAEAGRTRLVWARSRERDVVGYLVFVSQNGGEAVQLTPEPIRPSEYIHEGTVSGATYAYTVVAVDGTGNRSEPSEEATTRAP